MNAPYRPPLRYLGGKWRLAPHIIAHLPPHRYYVEPFGGGASVLLRKPRSYGEVWNDLDGDVCNLFQVLRRPRAAAELIRLLDLTPFHREEFAAAYAPSVEPVERARRLIVRSFMGHGSNACDIRRRVGFRGQGGVGRGRAPERDWSNYPAALAAVIERIDGVRFENRPAEQVIAQFDAPDTLVYADPPYLHETRSAKRIGGELYNAYAVEMDEEGHVALLDQLVRCQSMVVVSGYASELYQAFLWTWKRVEIAAYADGCRPRVEVLWINEAAEAALAAAGTAGGDA